MDGAIGLRSSDKWRSFILRDPDFSTLTAMNVRCKHKYKGKNDTLSERTSTHSMYNNSLHHGFGSIPRSILSVAGYVVLHSKSQWTQDWTTQFLHKRLRKDFNSEEKKILIP